MDCPLRNPAAMHVQMLPRPLLGSDPVTARTCAFTHTILYIETLPLRRKMPAGITLVRTMMEYVLPKAMIIGTNPIAAAQQQQLLLLLRAAMTTNPMDEMVGVA